MNSHFPMNHMKKGLYYREAKAPRSTIIRGLYHIGVHKIQVGVEKLSSLLV